MLNSTNILLNVNFSLTVSFYFHSNNCKLFQNISFFLNYILWVNFNFRLRFFVWRKLFDDNWSRKHNYWNERKKKSIGLLLKKKLERFSPLASGPLLSHSFSLSSSLFPFPPQVFFLQKKAFWLVIFVLFCFASFENK